MILGITGNIASGKSAVAAEFRRLGATVVDADQLAREVVEPGSETLKRLTQVFGSQILRADGSLNRNILADMIFSDEDARRQLNVITHPAIAELALSRLNELRRSQNIPLIVYEAPLLFEAGAQSRVDKILVVRIDPDVQRRRLMKRDHLNAADADKRIAAQMSQDEKLKQADYIIDNSTSYAQMKEQVGALWKRLIT